MSALREYGHTYLVDTTTRHRLLGAADLLDRVFADVHQWAGPRLDDDATAMAIAFERAGMDSVVP